MTKIISRESSLRLRPLLGSLASGYQTTFVKDRLIFRNFVMASGVIAFNKRKRTPGLLHKLDFEKVFDSVSGSFLFELF